MNDNHYWSEDHFSRHRIHERFHSLRDEVRQARMDSGADMRTVYSLLDQLETDIGRVILKVHAISDVLLEKGVVTTEELSAKARDLDLLDGHSDGKIHPAVFRTEKEQNQILSPRAFLLGLEKEDVVTPKGFLAKLEEEQSEHEESQDDEAQDEDA